MARIVLLASNYGLLAEELQAPWDALKKAGHALTLATYRGLTPLPVIYSVDPGFIDPMQHNLMNPPEVVERVNEILDTGEWDNAITIESADMSAYDAIVLTGGPGAALDITGNQKVHELLLTAYKTGKLIGSICYGQGALAMTRDPDNGGKSIIYGRHVTAHPAPWDFKGDLSYPLARTVPRNPATDLITPGFVYRLQFIVEDAVGDAGKVVSDATADRNNPKVAWDKPFVTGLSVESSIAFGAKLVEVLEAEY